MSDTLNSKPRANPQELNRTPAFPLDGLLPRSPREVANNLRTQQALNKSNWNRAQLASAKVGAAAAPLPCAKTLHITLCFDGTNNHEPSDSLANPTTTSNVAKLLHASLDGSKGGSNSPPTDSGYYRYYLQGVGTEFKEIGEYTPQGSGLIMASGGENRINWGLTRLLDCLGHACDGTNLKNEEAYALVQAMGSSLSADVLSAGLSNAHARRQQSLLEPQQALADKLASRQANKSSAQILGLQLYVYGFSRGAAEARAFANWLEQLSKVGEGQYRFAGLPISIVFMGLFDTVASVGMAYLMPFAAGHMGWADDSMRLPDNQQFLQHCVHLVAAHEQRGCFPLDSIRRKNNTQDPQCSSTYRAGTREYIYPGVHSDVGGGYPAGDQGKARGGSQEVLSQIALQHMYSEAFKVGAPLQVPKDALNVEQFKEKPWLAMDIDTSLEFDISPTLINRFNAWQKQLISGPLEQVMDREVEVLTAWRIERFVNATLAQQDFYRSCAGKDMTTAEIDAFKLLHNQQLEEDAAALGDGSDAPQWSEAQIKQHEAALQVKARYEQRTASPPTSPNTHKDFDPNLTQRQLNNAALDFRRDFVPEWNLREGEDGFSAATLLNTLFGGLIYMTNEQDEAEEYARMREQGILQHKRLFTATGAPTSEQTAQLIALFDNQLHDSRAWFMNASLNERELFSDYFRYRPVFFDNESSKRLSLLATAGQVIGVAVAVASIGLSIKRRDPRYLIGLVLPSLGTPVMRGKVGMPTISAFDTATGIALPMLQGIDAIRAFTQDTGSVLQLANALPLPPALSEATANTPELQSILKAADAAKALQAAQENKDISGLLAQAMGALDNNTATPKAEQPSWLDQAKNAASAVTS